MCSFYLAIKHTYFKMKKTRQGLSRKAGKFIVNLKMYLSGLTDDFMVPFSAVFRGTFL